MAASTMLIGGRAVTTGPVNGVAAHTGQTYFFFAPLFIPFFILGVPIVDMAFAFVRRTANRTGFATPDKNHLHHRLLRLGHGHRRSVLILWAWTVLLSGFILFPLYISSVNAVIPFGALALGVVLYTLFHPSLRRQTGPGPEGEAPLETVVDPELALVGSDAAAVGSDNAGNPDNPGNPDNAGNPGHPDHPDHPGHRGDPGNAGEPGDSGDRAEPGDSEEPVTSLPRPPGGRAAPGLGVRPVSAGSSRAARPTGSTGASGEV